MICALVTGVQTCALPIFGGALAGDLDLRGAAELVDEQRLPGAAPGQLTGAGVVGVAVDFRGLLAPAIGVDARLVDGGDLARALDCRIEQGMPVGLRLAPAAERKSVV